MTTTTSHRRRAIPGKLPGTFEALAGLMLPHVIVDDEDYAEVAAMLNKLVLIKDPTPGQRKYLDIIELTIADYDEKHPIDVSDISGIDLLRHLLKEHGMTASDLGRLLGNRALGSKILNGTRELSKTHMKVLGEHFKLSPGAFL